MPSSRKLPGFLAGRESLCPWSVFSGIRTVSRGTGPSPPEAWGGIPHQPTSTQEPGYASASQPVALNFEIVSTLSPSENWTCFLQGLGIRAGMEGASSTALDWTGWAVDHSSSSMEVRESRGGVV